ncbi:uncharacterized protein [Drosophila tropicalis]|uniref:uncharacterized protein n=1 Tax=Drosophila tropicalis TaxID=46794 RepID=UPI0035ABB8ED
MYTIEPDYIISDVGYPQYRSGDHPAADVAMFEQKVYSKCWTTSAYFSSYRSSSSCGSPSRLLPLRETLSDYNKRLWQREQMEKSNNRRRRCGEYNINDNYVDDNNEHDALVQQKLQKNRCNEQTRIKSNQKCRDKGKPMSTKSIHDLNSF